MARRIVPWTFWGGMLLGVVLLMGAVGARAGRPPNAVPDLCGAWDGFSLDADATRLGLVQSDVTGQANRRIAGLVALLDPQNGALFNAYNFQATLTAANFLNGTGRTPTGQVVFRADLALVAGVEGDAGVMQSETLFTPVRGRPGRLGSLLLHPFPDTGAPDLHGCGFGGFRSETDPAFRGDVMVVFDPRERGSYPGQFTFRPEAGRAVAFTWPIRATTSCAGRLVMIAQGQTGRAIYDGVVIPAPEGTFVGGFYRLLFNTGRIDYGAMNFNLATATR